MKTILCFVLVTLFAVPAAFGQEPAPKKTDSTFITEPAGLNVPAAAGQTISLTIKIDRVVAETDSDGKLPAANLTQLFANGIIKEYVTLEISAFDVDRDFVEYPHCTPRELNRVKVNGENIGTNNAEVFLDGTDRQWRKVSFQVPTKFIKFGKWSCASQGRDCNWGGEGENLIEIEVSTAAPAPFDCGGTSVDWSTKVAWAAFRVKALYPVVMVHGYDSDKHFWTASSHNFVEPFIQQKILFDDTVTLPNRGKGSILLDSDYVKNAIRNSANLFHVKHVHLVAHSKGGLVVRDYVSAPPPGIAVLSVTTLSTMHHGTALADFSLDFDEATWLGAAFSGEDVLSGLKNFVISCCIARGDDALKYMRVNYVENTFNPNNDLPHTMKVSDEETPVRYFSFGADANLNDNYTGDDPVNGSAVIETNEVTGSVFESRFAGRAAAGQAYNILYKIATTRVNYIRIPVLNKQIPTTITFTPVPAAQRHTTTINDFFVTVGSTIYEPPTGASFETQPQELKNHQLIAVPEIAQKVITKIKSTQP